MKRITHQPRQLGEKNPKRLVIRLPEVIRQTGMCKSQIYALKAKGIFPQSIKIGPRAVGWYEDEVQHYIMTRPRSDAGTRKA